MTGFLLYWIYEDKIPLEIVCFNNYYSFSWFSWFFFYRSCSKNLVFVNQSTLVESPRLVVCACLDNTIYPNGSFFVSCLVSKNECEN